MASMVSGVCTSPSTPSTGCFLPTYSGRGMDGGTDRLGEIRPGTSGVVMEYECSQRLTGGVREQRSGAGHPARTGGRGGQVVVLPQDGEGRTRSGQPQQGPARPLSRPRLRRGGPDPGPGAQRAVGGAGPRVE